MQSDSDKFCEIQCMLFNETALSICSAIANEVENQPKQICMSMNLDSLHIKKSFAIVECKNGWSLSDLPDDKVAFAMKFFGMPMVVAK